jgi:predicted anti-sigma-YlaC factor YlaD
MHEDMRNLLNAYLDGELHGWRLLEMQTHLASCESCRNELRELRSVSDLLHAAPLPEFTPADRFMSNLTLNLPRRPLKAQMQRGPSLAWLLAPLALIGAWFFVQTLITLSGAVSLAADSGLLEQGTAWLSSGAGNSDLYGTMMNLFGSEIGTSTQSALSTVDQVALFGNGLLNQLLWQAVVALLYWAWMAAWWLRTRGRLLFGKPVRALGMK